MQTTFALVAALASLALGPAAAAPAGCTSSYSGKFEITAYNLSSVAKRDVEKRTCDAEGSLTITLADGILTDAKGRTGYIAANHQFQFDGPVQAGALSQSGWSVCANGSLALGGSNVFYQCKSGNPDGSDSGAFYNLYDDMAFDICSEAALNILPCGASSGGVGQQTDGQPTGAAATPAPVSQISDGQPQAASGLPISQIPDGQIQVPTGAPISQIGDGQVQAPTGAPISQIGDGQVQAPTGAPISQISDGQVQAPTGAAAPISQISDGQVQAPTATVAPISQISDGQVQAPTATVAPISQISDGQVQAPTGAPITQISDGQVQAPTTAAGAPVSQISDGQVQAPTSAASGNSTSTVVPFTGSGNSIKAGIVTIFFGVVAVALL